MPPGPCQSAKRLIPHPTHQESDYNQRVGEPRRREEKRLVLLRGFPTLFNMRFLHIFVAIGIALVANSIEPAWLGLVALLAMLGAYAWFAIRLQQHRGKAKRKAPKQ